MYFKWIRIITYWKRSKLHSLKSFYKTIIVRKMLNFTIRNYTLRYIFAENNFQINTNHYVLKTIKIVFCFRNNWTVFSRQQLLEKCWIPQSGSIPLDTYLLRIQGRSQLHPHYRGMWITWVFSLFLIKHCSLGWIGRMNHDGYLNVILLSIRLHINPILSSLY